MRREKQADRCTPQKGRLLKMHWINVMSEAPAWSTQGMTEHERSAT
jgi:hypothetical protein